MSVSLVTLFIAGYLSYAASEPQTLGNDVNTALLERVATMERKLIEQGQKIKHLERENQEQSRLLSNLNKDGIALQRGTRQSEMVAFTSYLDHNIDNLGIDHPIAFNKVLLNEGNAYNTANGLFKLFRGCRPYGKPVATINKPKTTTKNFKVYMITSDNYGIHMVSSISGQFHCRFFNKLGMFTCPDDGFYVFYFQVATNGIHQIVAKLVINGVNQVDGISDTHETYHESQGGNLAVEYVRKGQAVWVANYRWADKSIQVSNSSRFATFSGFRIY